MAEHIHSVEDAAKNDNPEQLACLVQYQVSTVRRQGENAPYAIDLLFGTGIGFAHADCSNGKKYDFTKFVSISPSRFLAKSGSKLRIDPRGVFLWIQPNARTPDITSSIFQQRLNSVTMASPPATISNADPARIESLKAQFTDKFTPAQLDEVSLIFQAK